MKINTLDLLDEVHMLAPNVNKEDTKQIFHTLFQVIGDHLVDGDDVHMYRLGAFEISQVPVRQHYYFNEKKVIEKGETCRVKFIISTSLLDRVKDSYAKRAGLIPEDDD